MKAFVVDRYGRKQSLRFRPVVDRIFPFEATNEALAYVEAGRSKGKVVVGMKRT